MLLFLFCFVGCTTVENNAVFLLVVLFTVCISALFFIFKILHWQVNVASQDCAQQHDWWVVVSLYFFAAAAGGAAAGGGGGGGMVLA